MFLNGTKVWYPKLAIKIQSTNQFEFSTYSLRRRNERKLKDKTTLREAHGLLGLGLNWANVKACATHTIIYCYSIYITKKRPEPKDIVVHKRKANEQNGVGRHTIFTKSWLLRKRLYLCNAILHLFTRVN